MRIVQRMACSLLFLLGACPRQVCQSETVRGRAQVLPLTMGIMGPGNEDGNLWAALPRLILTYPDFDRLPNVGIRRGRNPAIARCGSARRRAARRGSVRLRMVAATVPARPRGCGIRPTAGCGRGMQGPRRGACAAQETATVRTPILICGGPGVTVFSTTRPHPFARGADKASENRA